MNLKIYSVSDEYVNYLRKFDNKIYDNKENIRTHTRKYVGVVIKIENMNYYIPMSSPKKTDYFDKECTKIRPSVNTIVRMTAKNKDGILELRGTLRISNMIPVPITEIMLYDVDSELDIKYKDIIMDEIAFLRNSNNKKNIINKAKLVHKQKNNNFKIKYLDMCVNYKLLEEKCIEYPKK